MTLAVGLFKYKHKLKLRRILSLVHSFKNGCKTYEEVPGLVDYSENNQLQIFTMLELTSTRAVDPSL